MCSTAESSQPLCCQIGLSKLSPCRYSSPCNLPLQEIIRPSKSKIPM
ncbi:Uncharacterised protein [Vibrio cholerae]|nr:Uncharacterised protein [Vibrio cholerae]